MTRAQRDRHGPGSSPRSYAVSVVTAAGSERATLENLMQLYLHDFSEFDSSDVDEAGRYRYRYLPLYWSEPGRWPFLVRADGNIAGFALVRHADGRYQMAEFFVLRRYRRRGVGEEAARQVFARFPGPWLVEELAANTTAIKFWRSVIGRFAGGFDEVQGPGGPQQLFESPMAV
ncbi:MAG: GNAT family N-acetyltransferase [Thermoflexaceae bacterium]|nr:GNAT family N-acetyltransferase [Thermoflexaceae bacterium]